ncbi:MAG: tetraacyldisaccharide 4'-kinase [Gemmatimonadales bacterium]
MRVVDGIWYGDGLGARAARALLAPAGWAFGRFAAARNAAYDAGLLRAHDAALPTLSLGNLTVGGTGKTPVAAWAVGRLLDAGARPAVVMRGYGDDEPLVHERLNPGAIVVADADRLRGVRRAAERGADCVILDDAFQHRRIRRDADWLLVATEQWRSDLRCLPAGPLRESASSTSRATLIVVTRKSASRECAESVAKRLSARSGVDASAIVHLAPDGLVDARTGDRADLTWLRGRAVVGVAAVGVPAAFFAQLREEGAVVREAKYADHHAFDASDVERILRSAATADAVVCTLKDAVKLAPSWPHEGPRLWYVSQRTIVERGAAVLDVSLASLLAARTTVAQTAGPAGPSSPAHGYRSSTADQ